MDALQPLLQIIRHRLEVLYPTTLGVRFFFLAVISALYVETRDRLFLMVLGVVAFGVSFTLVSYLVERPKGRAHG